MTAMLITVVTPDESIDLSIPSDLPLASLVGLLEPELGSAPAGWTISDGHGSPIDAATTPEQAGVRDGEFLFLTPAEPESSVDCRAPRSTGAATDPRPAPPVVPLRVAVGSRLLAVLDAAIGSRRQPGSAGPLDRARRAWHWTDHSMRLRWLLSRPLLRRSVLIGVVGHRSDEIAEGLADTLASIRLDRVVLVDRSAGGSLTRRLAAPARGPESIESALRDGGVSSIELDGLLARTRRGTPAIPGRRPGAPVPSGTTRQLYDSLTRHAGIVIADCGGFETADTATLELCEQVVAATTEGVPEFRAQTIAAVWGQGELPDAAFAARRIEDIEHSVAELALLVVSGWSAIEAATAVPTTP